MRFKRQKFYFSLYSEFPRTQLQILHFHSPVLWLMRHTKYPLCVRCKGDTADSQMDGQGSAWGSHPLVTESTLAVSADAWHEEHNNKFALKYNLIISRSNIVTGIILNVSPWVFLGPQPLERGCTMFIVLFCRVYWTNSFPLPTSPWKGAFLLPTWLFLG